jgi:sulfur relay (sulfurtransferase) complex TusBCD TusD component (DsrE family)
MTPSPPPNHPNHRSRLGLLVVSGPAAGDLRQIVGTAATAVQAGDEVALFLMDDGVGYALLPELQPLLQLGVEVTLCAMDAEARGLDCATAAAAGVILGSQYDHARLVRDSDRVLSFT